MKSNPTNKRGFFLSIPFFFFGHTLHCYNNFFHHFTLHLFSFVPLGCLAFFFFWVEGMSCLCLLICYPFMELMADNSPYDVAHHYLIWFHFKRFIYLIYLITFVLYDSFCKVLSKAMWNYNFAEVLFNYLYLLSFIIYFK